ncbi:MAG: prepilin-type N-terminal cleavage/methylation domain-containing protein [Verrucomicrobiota bacterium]
MKTKVLDQPGELGRSGFAGFTLVELLVVITIISILSAIAVPAFQNVIESGRQTRALAHAKQIASGIRAYAMDSGGQFPIGKNQYGQEINTANDAFRDLVPDYLEDERIFAIAGSGWGPRADNRMDGVGEVLESGENHFAYIAGLGDASKNWWPLIVDGTTGSGVYTREEGVRGGRWKGKRAVVVNVDGSASVTRLKGESTRRYIPRVDDERMNALNVEAYMPEGVQLLEPAG